MISKFDSLSEKTQVWMCIEKITYKNLSPSSLHFSEDGSLLAAGFGNILCVWDSATFTLKCSLSAPACMDGSIAKLTFLLPSKDSTEITEKEKSMKIKEVVEKRKKIIEEMRKIINGEGDEKFLKELVLSEKSRVYENKRDNFESAKNLSLKEKQSIFRRIFMINELSFYQKINLLHKLNIGCDFTESMEKEIKNYLKRNFESHQNEKTSLKQLIDRVNENDKYELQKRFQDMQRDNHQDVILLKSIVQLKNLKDDENSLKKKKNVTYNRHGLEKPFAKPLTTINTVLFCTEEFSHLVVVTTGERLLIWNLLTLKLQVSYKLSASYVALDPVSNLIAVFTRNRQRELS